MLIAFVRMLLTVLLILPVLASAAPLRVVLDQNYPPFVLRNSRGELEGYSVDLWRLWQRKTGVEVELDAANWADVQPALLRGQADVADIIYRTEARSARFDFSAPYASTSTAIYVHASIAGIHDIDSLRGFEVAVQAGDACVDRLQRAGITAIRVFPTYDALFAAVAGGSVKLLCMDDYPANYQLYRLGLHQEYVKAFDVARNQVRRAVRKGDRDTLALVERGMAQISPAEMRALNAKWLGRPLEFARYARRLMEVLAVLGGLVLLLAVWLRSVRKAVRRRTAQLEHEQARIRTMDRLLGEMSALAHVGAWELDPASGILKWTDEVARIYDMTEDEQLTLAHCLSCADAADQAMVERALDAATTHGKPFDLELQIACGARTRKWVRVLCSPVLENGRVTKLRGTVQDVTHRRNLEESMRTANLIYQTSSEAIVVTDDANRIVDANPAFTRQTGYELREVLGSHPPLFDSSMHDSVFYTRMWQDLKLKDHWQGEVLDRNKDGSFTAKFVNIRVIRQPDGRVYRHVIQFNDISAQKEKDDLIWRQTNFDSLTGLPNRRLFLDRLEQAMKKADGVKGTLGVLLLDLDRFKDINDSFGHAKGDSALIELTRRIAGCIPEDATIGRLGGDAFALLIDDVGDHSNLDIVAETVIKAISAPLRLGADDLAYVSAGVGISVYPDDGADAEDLVSKAEHAVHLAKRAGRGKFQYFTLALQQQAHAKLMLTNDLREALARRQLHLYYQPIVEVATGHIHKAETLLRWAHPERGDVSPALFIPLAEETGLIEEICDWVLGETIASARRWNEMAGRVIELSVNISPSQFEQRGALPWLDRVVHSGLPRNSITVEITEGVLVNDTEQVMRCVGTLHAAGFRVSIDDFGTGFSALSYLKLFDVDYLKIDKSFIHHLASDGNDKALTEAIVDLAHRLGIQAIAEGVEDRAQRDLLAAIGCDYIQGHFYSQAVPREAFEDLLERQMAH